MTKDRSGTDFTTNSGMATKLKEAMPCQNKYRIAIIGVTIAITLGIHYGWVLEPLFGVSHWIHAIHGRLCYIPIVIAASWFGIRGGLWAATVISVMVLPFIFINDLGAHNLAGEVTEIVFYYALAILTGALISREFRLRRKNQEAQLQLERSHKLSMVGQMAAGVAHEIKNPIASIKGAMEILCDKNTSENDKAEFRGIVARETKRIDGTLKDFLEFARPQESSFEMTDLTSTIAGGLKQVEGTALQQGITIERTLESGITVRGDSEKLHQVMLNLLLNAMEASSSGDTVKVSLKKEGGLAVIEVTDNGSGISEEARERLFDPFFTTKSSGTGLGLAIAKQIVERHDGSIEIDSDTANGTTFRVHIPIPKEVES